MTQVFHVDPQNIDTGSIQAAADVLRKGGLVAFPTETVYGLGANAFEAVAVAKIFVAKGRPAADPLIVHIADDAQLTEVVAEVPDIAHRLAKHFWPGALTLILKRGTRIPLNVTAGQETVAVRMPDHAVALALIRAAGVPIAAPSANLFSRPSPTSAAHVLDDLRGRIDVLLDGGSTTLGLESTILDLTGDVPRVLRPGGVPVEAIREILPDVELAPRFIQHETAQAMPAPGTAIKHYSPSAEVILISGSAVKALKRMHELAEKLTSEGKRVGILSADEEAARFEKLPVEIYQLGSLHDLGQIGTRLFAGLRDLDHRHVDVILVREFPRFGLGLAIWDRLVRAAEGRIERVEE